MEQENKNNLPAKLNLPPEQVTEQLIIAFLNMQFAKGKVEFTIQSIENLIPDKANISQCSSILKELDANFKKGENVIKDAGSFYYNAHKLINKVGKGILQPIDASIESFRQKVKVVDDSIIEDSRIAREAVEAENKLSSSINDFINKATAFVASASANDIVLLEKRIGSEKSKYRTHERKDEIYAQFDSLLPLIKQRKEVLLREEKLKKESETATDERKSEIKDELDAINDEKEENLLRLQEIGFDQSSQNEIIVGEPTSEEVSGRFYWQCRVDDINLLLKKHPELVKIIENKEAVEELKKKMREEGKMDGKTEVKIPGLTFYKEKRI